MAHDLYPHPDDVQEQIDALPGHARDDFDAALSLILSAPYDQSPYNPVMPHGMRQRFFGTGLGMILFAVRHDDAVQVELVQWLGW